MAGTITGGVRRVNLTQRQSSFVTPTIVDYSDSQEFGGSYSIAMDDRLRQMIETGVNVLGTTSSAVISAVTGNPEFSVGAAALGATDVYKRVGAEIANRLLGPREQARIGGVLALSAEVLREKLDQGCTLRTDNFFDTPSDGRSEADEILECVLRKAQAEYEEKKLPYYARFWANACISNSFDTAELNFLMKLSEQLTYKHFIIISMLGKIVGSQYTEIENFRYPPHEYETDKEFLESDTSEIPITLIAEMEHLDRLRCIQFREKTRNDFPTSRPPHIIHGIYGSALYKFMELYKIPESDCIPLATLLKWPLAWRHIEDLIENQDPDPKIGSVRARI